MKTTYFKHVGFLLCLCALFILGCQQEDDIEKQTRPVVQKLTTKTISGKDLPEVLNFIQSKSNSRMQFRLDDSNSPEGQFRNHEDNLSLTTTITEQIKQVTNNYGKSNYTFKLIEEETKEGVYFLNLVVKEYKDTFYLYITKYLPELNWLKTYRAPSDFTSFTGTVYYYSDEGNYLLKVDKVNGISTSINKHPCSGNEEDDNNDDTTDDANDSSSGSTGGGDASDNPNNDEENNNDGSGTGNVDWGDYGDGSDWGDVNDPEGNGGSCDLVIVTTCVSHEPGQECSEEGIVETHYWDCSGHHSPSPIGSSTDPFNTFLRHPCDPDEDCPNVTDCEYGWDDNCECLDEPIDEEEEESGDVGVFIDLEIYEQLVDFFGEGNIEIDNTLTDEETISFNSIEDIQDFFDDLINTNFENGTSEMFPGSIREDNHSMPFSSFPEAVLLARIKVNVPDANNDLECLQLISLNTNMEGNITFFDWLQTSHHDPNNSNGPLVTINEAYDIIRYTIHGEMIVGIDLDGLPFNLRTRKLISIDIVYNYSTGELIEDYSYWYYTIN